MVLGIVIGFLLGVAATVGAWKLFMSFFAT